MFCTEARPIPTIPNAVAHLNGDEHPAGFKRNGQTFPSTAPTAGYDPEIDLALGTMLTNTAGMSLNNVIMRLARKHGNLITHLHEALKEHVARSDTATQLRLEDELAVIKQGSESIQKLGDRLLGMFERCENAGMELSERQQVARLLKSVNERYAARRSTILESLDRHEPITFNTALEKFKREEQLFSDQTKSDVTATARMVRDDTHQQGNGNSGAGGADGGGGRRAGRGPQCYECKKW
ncbi:hypothetical protein A4X13_0g6183, partial [Tilletia indica]